MITKDLKQVTTTTTNFERNEMKAQTVKKMTPQEYLAMERQNEYKSEYLNGQVFAMAGASRWHNLIITNVVRELSTQLKKQPCEVYPSDMRVRIPRTGLYTYPDVTVVCGKPEFEDEHRDTLLNPMLIVEVLSPSTEAYDRGAKFGHYRKIESLQEYVLISQEKPLIERFLRQEGTSFWVLSEAEGLHTAIDLSSISGRLELAEVYEKVKFESLS
jgi:Uma2 family endonuclease